MGRGRRAGARGNSRVRLGGRFDPMLTGGNPNDDKLSASIICRSRRTRTSAVLRRRLSLADQLGAQSQQLQELAVHAEYPRESGCGRSMCSLFRRPCARAVDLAAISWRGTGSAMGRNLFGQSVLLGRRLLDARRSARAVQTGRRTQRAQRASALGHALEQLLGPQGKIWCRLTIRAFNALMTDLDPHRQGSTRRWSWSPPSSGRSPKITRLQTAAANIGPNAIAFLFAGGGIPRRHGGSAAPTRIGRLSRGLAHDPRRLHTANDLSLPGHRPARPRRTIRPAGPFALSRGNPDRGAGLS